MPEFLFIVLRTIVALGVIIALTRYFGLRSFSKMSGFEFAVTVSIGSVLAGAVTTLDTPLFVFVIALAALFAVQYGLARLRTLNDRAQQALDNDPLMILENGEVLDENLAQAGMTRDDLWAKLREANAYDISAVFAVVVENTGDISVLHGPSENGPSPELLDGLRR
ncbi:DUF421 domain-containing protein [Sulfitobacter sp. S190]|uniref:DUF421 domain-containing protein n=1 Tax=Sulfitobacter sp. S190 TaxID=2867022 RepID=UPI0021A28B84|nr:YetF domain-containing protein [Sulfitobacter sp. S190]UWR21052.1 DUF421 domain-containing protein [Sulfitobacter sp. S190]